MSETTPQTPEHTFSTRKELRRSALSVGDQIAVTYESKRSETPVTYRGILTEIEEHPLSVMLKLEPYYAHESRRYVSLFDDDSNIHSSGGAYPPKTLNEIHTTVTCEHRGEQP